MTDPTPLNPVAKLYLQYNGGYYPVPIDPTTGILMLPGTGICLVTHGGKIYASAVADPNAAPSLAGPALIADLIAMLSSGIVTAQPGADLTALMQSGGMVEVAAGTYGGFTVPGA